jgi:uncharacterized protein (UPF0128 family)
MSYTIEQLRTEHEKMELKIQDLQRQVQEAFWTKNKIENLIQMKSVDQTAIDEKEAELDEKLAQPANEEPLEG